MTYLNSSDDRVDFLVLNLLDYDSYQNLILIQSKNITYQTCNELFKYYDITHKIYNKGLKKFYEEKNLFRYQQQQNLQKIIKTSIHHSKILICLIKYYRYQVIMNQNLLNDFMRLQILYQIQKYKQKLMYQKSMKCLKPNHKLKEIEQYVCKYAECKQISRFLCSQCILEVCHNHQEQDNSQLINKKNYDQQQLEYIKNAKINTKQIANGDKETNWIATISNDLKYIILGQNKILNIWDYQTYNLIRPIKFNDDVYCCKFTDDSRKLYVGTYDKLYQIQFNKELKKCFIMINIYDFCDCIQQIYCLSQTKVLITSSYGIIQAQFKQKKQIFKIKAQNNGRGGLDYNKRLNLIVFGSFRSIKLWNHNNRTLIIDHKYNQNQGLIQVLFVQDFNYLVSLDAMYQIIIWKINYQRKQLECYAKLNEYGYNISLVLDKQFLIITSIEKLIVYTTQGSFIRSFQCDFQNLSCSNTIQIDSLKAVLVIGKYKVYVCKISLN